MTVSSFQLSLCSPLHGSRCLTGTFCSQRHLIWYELTYVLFYFPFWLDAEDVLDVPSSSFPITFGTHLLPPFLPTFAWYFIICFTLNYCPVSLIHQWLETLVLRYKAIFPFFQPVLAKGHTAVTACGFSAAFCPGSPKSSSAFVHLLAWHFFAFALAHVLVCCFPWMLLLLREELLALPCSV